MSPDPDYHREWQRKNKEKLKAYHRAWAEKNPDKVLEASRKKRRDHPERCRAYQNKWRSDNKDRVRLYGLKAKYGLSEEEASLLYANPVCGVCGAKENLHVDHDHATSAVRGLLCKTCNTVEGYIKKTGLGLEDFCERMKAYLTAPPFKA